MRDGINLLEGEFKPTDKSFSRLWGINITLATMLCALMFGYLQLDVKKISVDLREIEQHIEVSYGRIFSGESIEVDELRNAFDTQLRRMLAQRKATESMPLAGLRALSNVMSNCGCDLHSLDASSDTIRLRVDRSAELRRRALKLSEFDVDIETIDESSDRLLLTLSLRRDQ